MSIELWFFVWTGHKRHNTITTLCSTHQREIHRQAEECFGRPWKQIYLDGGRAWKGVVTV